MDAGRIRSFIPNVDVRADTSGDAPGRRSDAAAAFAAKIAPLAALDSLLHASEGADPAGVPVAAQPPRSSVVVTLSTPALSAEAALKIATAAPSPNDYAHLDPQRASTERRSVDAAPSGIERIRDMAGAPGAAITDSGDRGTSRHAPPVATPEVRHDLQAHALAHGAAHAQIIQSAAQKLAASPVSQARDTERLAGLAVSRDVPGATTTPAYLGKLLLGAAIVALLLLVLL